MTKPRSFPVVEEKELRFWEPVEYVLQVSHPKTYLPGREFFIDNLLVRIYFFIVMIRRTGLAPWEFELPFPGSLTSTFLPPCRLAVTGHFGNLSKCDSHMAITPKASSLSRKSGGRHWWLLSFRCAERCPRGMIMISVV